MFRFTEKTRAIWFVEIPGGDWTACIEDSGGGHFRLEYRFRHYQGPGVWDGKDEKHWYTVTGSDLAKGIEATRLIIKRMKTEGAGESWELLRGVGTLKQFMAEFMKLPFVHAKRATKEQVEEYQRTGRVPT
jgi:hypothetical protein